MMLWSAESEHPGLISHEIRQTDMNRQTTCSGNTTLCIASRGINTLVSWSCSGQWLAGS